MAPSDSGSPHILIDIRVMSDFPVDYVPDSFFQSKHLNGLRFSMKGGLIRGKISRDRSRIVIKVHPAMIESDASRVFEQSFYQIYYGILGADACTAPLIHSSGVIKEGRGYLFLGPSEAGKSTVASLSSDYSVINDEITIADISGGEPLLVSTPFNGLFREKTAGSAPLSGIFILEKSAEDDFERVFQSSAVRPVAEQIIPPVPIDEEMRGDIYFSQLDIAAALQSCVPVYRLRFTKSKKFWDVIAAI